MTDKERVEVHVGDTRHLFNLQEGEEVELIIECPWHGLLESWAVTYYDRPSMEIQPAVCPCGRHPETRTRPLS